jgi:DDE family transposase
VVIMTVSDACLDHRKRTVPASASLSIPAIAEQVGEVELPDPVVLAPALSVVLEKLADPRKARGIRHRLAMLLTVTVCAVAAGARTFVAVAEWVADLPAALADTVGTSGRCPSESTIRRTVQVIDADAFDTVIGGFVQQLCAAAARAGRRQVLAVDGKTLRGSRHTDATGVEVPGRHLLAVIDQHTRVVLGQVDVETKTNEVRHEAPCRIPNSVRRNLEDSSWVRWLTRSRNGQWEPKHAINPRSCPDARSDALGGTRVIWRKLNCLNPNLQRCKSSSTGKGICNRCRALHPVISLPGATSRALGDIQ